MKKAMKETEEILIVDGYNCIHQWPHLAKIQETSLPEARLKLVEELAEYRAFTGRRVIVVFDAYRVHGLKQQEVVRGVEVQYTDEEESADERIERLARCLVGSFRHIYVATSDYTEQRIVLAQGALRISARELLEEVDNVRQKVKETLKDRQQQASIRSIASLLPQELEEELESWRRGEKDMNSREEGATGNKPQRNGEKGK